MAVISRHAKSVIDDYQPPVSRAFVRLDDHAVSGHSHRIAVLRGDIYARVESAFTAERVHALAKRARQMADHWPQSRRGSQVRQARRGDQLQAAGRKSRLAYVLLQKIELRHGLLKAAGRRLRAFVQAERA